jgi:hypothetical protein
MQQHLWMYTNANMICGSMQTQTRRVKMALKVVACTALYRYSQVRQYLVGNAVIVHLVSAVKGFVYFGMFCQCIFGLQITGFAIRHSMIK